MTFGMKAGLIGLSLALAPLAANAASAPADATRGAALFKQRCGICHSTVVDTGPRPAPSMKGIVGRKAGTVANFKYSPALQKYGQAWNKTSLDAFVAAPAKVVPGTFMVISLPAPQDRADVIAYMETLK